MSDQERIKGRLRKLDRDAGVTLEQHCQTLLENEGQEKSKYHDTYEEAVRDNMYDKYIIHDGDIYHLTQTKEDAYDAFIDMTRLPDGDIVFHTSFHNGGTCLSEMIEDGLSRPFTAQNSDNLSKRLAEYLYKNDQLYFSVDELQSAISKFLTK